MRRIPATVFRRTCLRLLDELRETGESIVITKHCKPVAELTPLPRASGDWIGSMRGTARMADDLVAPACDEDEWEVLRS